MAACSASATGGDLQDGDCCMNDTELRQSGSALGSMPLGAPRSREVTPKASSRATEVNDMPAQLRHAPDQPRRPSSRPPSNTSLKRLPRTPAPQRSSRAATGEGDNARTNHSNALTAARGTVSTGQETTKTVSKPESVQIAHGTTYTKSRGFAGIKQLAVASLGRRAEVR